MPHLSMADANGNPDAFLTDPAFGGYLSSVLASDANKGVRSAANAPSNSARKATVTTT